VVLVDQVDVVVVLEENAFFGEPGRAQEAFEDLIALLVLGEALEDHELSVL
jgi:hypothetical protein